MQNGNKFDIALAAGHQSAVNSDEFRFANTPSMTNSDGKKKESFEMSPLQQKIELPVSHIGTCQILNKTIAMMTLKKQAETMEHNR